MAIARFRGFLGKFKPFHGVRNVVSSSTPTANLGRRPPLDEATRLLFNRISPMGDKSASVVSILDQWVLEGNELQNYQLTNIIKELRSHKRYIQALQMSMWMSEKSCDHLAPRDISIRLDLISKVHGVEEAEKYFNTIPVSQRTIGVYGALLNSYATAKCVEKAEFVMLKMRYLGLARGILEYNTLLGVYLQTGNFKKIETLVQEMEEKQIRFNTYTYCLLIQAYAAKSGSCKIDEILRKTESDGLYGGHWSIYTTATERYMEAGLVDKAVKTLRIGEECIARGGTECLAYDFLITQYAKAGCKNDVMRVWEIYRTRKRVMNKGYIRIIQSLLRLNDIESAEQVFEEWKSKDLTYDVRIPNYLIKYYAMKGSMEKAKTIVRQMMLRGKLNGKTWYYMASGYLQEGKSREAVKAMEEALKITHVDEASKWSWDKDMLVACLKFLEEEGNGEKTEGFVGLLEDKGVVRPHVRLRLLDYIRSGLKETEDIARLLEDNGIVPRDIGLRLIDYVKSGLKCGL